MKPQTEKYFREVIAGSRQDLAATLLRGALSVAEPVYAGGMIARNWLFDTGIYRAHNVQRPVVSIGNLTTGGTGKTPMVKWMAEQLRRRGRHVAVISRGYKSVAGQLGDEQRMLDQLLNRPGIDRVVIRANPDRIAAADSALKDFPEIDLFLLDDGFQHRRVSRNFDLVLLSATDPFGCEHVLPRGLLREPVRGLRRAGAVVVTHANMVSEGKWSALIQRIRGVHPNVDIFCAIHACGGFRTAARPAHQSPDRSLEDLTNVPFFGFSGLGNPESFQRMLQSIGGKCVGNRHFADHHAYTSADLDALRAEATAEGARVLLTSEKDWVKVALLPGAGAVGPEIWRVDLEIQFHDDGGEKLLENVMKSIVT